VTEREIQEAILRVCKVAGHDSDINMDGFLFFCNKLKRLGAEVERKAVLYTVDELAGMERDRHPMFSDGYDHALQHIAQFVQGRGKREL
jgi:hypothetical protein